MHITETSVEQNILAVRQKIEAACQRVGRDPAEVTLIAVTKTVKPETAQLAIDAGVADIGENRVQEYRNKRENLDSQINVRQVEARSDRGLILCNPPYGERLLDQKGAALLAKETGEVLTNKLPNWRVGMISALEDFATHYGQKPAMNRKLYNAKLKCYFYLFDPNRPDKRSK